MENQGFAKVFYEIADILEMKDENPFRIRSYRNAAQALEGLSEEITSLYERGQLQEIPGVGESIAKKIEEIIKTGKCKFHQELMSEISPGVIEMMNLPGMGPKSTMLVYKRLKIDSVEKLEEAAKKGKLRSLPRMGAKLEEKILKGVEQFKASEGRFKLITALSYAEDIGGQLGKLKEVERLEFAGSLRRKKEMIGDVDILVTSKKPEKIMDTFTSLRDVKTIVAKGHTKSSVILDCGLQVDVRVLKPSSFGAALHYFTGSKEHNIAIRDLGKKRGLKINEYGVFKGDKKVGGREEIDVFKSVGLSYIEPELREDRGEIEASRMKRLPALVELKDIKGDLHVHTKASDGKYTIEQMAEAARDRGYEYIAITEHSKAVTVAHGLDEKRLLKHIDEIDRINERVKGIRILRGIEVDIKADGTLDLKDEVLERCHVVVAAVHSKFNMPKDEMTSRILKAMENKNLKILAHPTGRLLKAREPYQVDMEKVLKAAKAAGVIMELNAFPDRLDLNDIHCKLAKELGLKMALGTDAHHTMHLDNMRYGVYTARRGWLEKKDVINTLPLEKMLKQIR